MTLPRYTVVKLYAGTRLSFAGTLARVVEKFRFSEDALRAAALGVVTLKRTPVRVPVILHNGQRVMREIAPHIRSWKVEIIDAQ